MKRKKKLALLTAFLGIGIGVGMGIASFAGLHRDHARNTGNEIAIGYEEDSDGPVMAEEDFDDELIIDSGELLPAAPLDESVTTTTPPSGNDARKSRAATQTAAVAAPATASPAPSPQQAAAPAAGNEDSTKAGSSQETATAPSGTTGTAARTASASASATQTAPETPPAGTADKPAEISPEKVAEEYRRRLPIKVGKFQTLTDFTYSRKEGFTYHIRTTREDITSRMRESLPEYACGNRQVQIFMQYAEKVNFRFLNATDAHISTVSIPRSQCTALLRKKEAGAGSGRS